MKAKHRLEFAAVRLADRALSALPLSWALRIGEFLGRVLCGSLPRRRRLVRNNLRAAFPDADESRIREIAGTMWRNLGRTAAEFVRMPSLLSGPDAVPIEIIGEEKMTAVLDRGQGIVVVALHLANWELHGAILQRRTRRLVAVARAMNNPLVEAWVQGKRGSAGTEVISHRNAVRGGLRTVRSGKALGLLVDQNLYQGGVFVRFFNRPAATTTLPALVRIRTGAPIFLTYAVRSGAGFRIFYEELNLPVVADGDDAVLVFTQAISDALEAVIRRFPDQWFWIHNRWKRQPPPETAPSAPGDAA